MKSEQFLLLLEPRRSQLTYTCSIHIAVWMVIFIAFIGIVNLLGVRVFGELEFYASSLKVGSLLPEIMYFKKL
jgi:amino acid permease